MSRTRAERRHKEEVTKVRARKVMKQNWGLEKPPLRAVGRMAHSMQLCSCSMCCNERRSPWLSAEEKLTMQERRDKEEAQFELQDIA